MCPNACNNIGTQSGRFRVKSGSENGFLTLRLPKFILSKNYFKIPSKIGDIDCLRKCVG